MVKTDREPRASGILNPDEQRIAQELFDHAFKNGREVVLSEGEEVTIATVTRYRAHGSSMELFRHGQDFGQVTLRLRRGRAFWHDDGAEGLAGDFGDLSKVGSEAFHPDAGMRDRILRKVHDVFISPPANPNNP